MRSKFRRISKKSRFSKRSRRVKRQKKKLSKRKNLKVQKGGVSPICIICGDAMMEAKDYKLGVFGQKLNCNNCAQPDSDETHSENHIKITHCICSTCLDISVEIENGKEILLRMVMQHNKYGDAVMPPE